MTIVDICRLLSKRGDEYQFASYSFAEVAVARNILASIFLASDHELFIGIDDDISLKHRALLKLLEYDADFLAVYQPQRRIDLDAFEREIIAGKSGKQAQFNAAPYVGVGSNPRNPEYGQIDKVERIGTGFYILKKTVLQSIVDSGLATLSPLNTPNFSTEVYGFFDNIIDRDGVRLSEDFSFCERVRQAGFDIHAYLGPGVVHTGTMSFES